MESHSPVYKRGNGESRFESIEVPTRGKCAPSPPCGERGGVRGSLGGDGESWTRGESPSPEFELRANSTSPRKRGEVKSPALGKQRWLLPRRALLRFHHSHRGHVEDASRRHRRG